MEKFIGLIFQPSSQYNIVFIANNNIRIAIDDIVYINHFEKDQIVVYQILKIQSNYNLSDTEGFFITHASKNNLEQLTSQNSKPTYSLYATCKILGIYSFQNNEIILENDKIAKYTPPPLEKVFPLPTNLVTSVLGLSFNTKDIDLGTLVYPIKTNAYFNQDVFRKHTIISGVTGSGKSRLVSLIIRELLRLNAQLTVFDPHDEYLELISSHSKCEIYYNSRSIKRTIYKSDNKNVKYRDINFYEGFILPSLLGALLPSITDFQLETLYDVYNKIISVRKDSSGFLSKPLMRLSDYINSVSSLYEPFDDLKYTSKKSNFLAESYHGLLTKLKKVDEEGSFIPDSAHINWLKENLPSLDILNLDYSTDASTRRFVHAILQSFLGGLKLNSIRVLLIDEVHLLLTDKESKTYQQVCRLLRESRKFNISIIFITQNIFDIPAEVVNQFHNVISFRQQDNPELANLEDRVCQVKLYKGRTDFNLLVRNTDH